MKLNIPYMFWRNQGYTHLWIFAIDPGGIVVIFAKKQEKVFVIFYFLCFILHYNFMYYAQIRNENKALTFFVKNFDHENNFLTDY